MLLQFYQVKKGDDQDSSTYVLHPAQILKNRIDFDGRQNIHVFYILIKTFED